MLKEKKYIFHFREFDGKKLLARGGGTIIYDSTKGIFSVALCHNKDCFNKKLGRQIALARFKGTKDGRFIRLIKIDRGIVTNIEQLKTEAASIYNNLRKILLSYENPVLQLRTPDDIN